jgi:putative endonuclease
MGMNFIMGMGRKLSGALQLCCIKEFSQPFTLCLASARLNFQRAPLCCAPTLAPGRRAASAPNTLSSRAKRLKNLCHKLLTGAKSRDPESGVCRHAAAGNSLPVSSCYDSGLEMAREHEYWVYIMASLSGTLYTGITGAFFTRQYKCNRLVYCERFEDVRMAIAREKQIKRWRRSKKIALIEKVNPRWQDLAEHWGQTMLFRGQSMKETP